MAESHDDPFPESALDEALEQAWGVKQREGESVVAHLERLPGVRSRVLLHEAPEEDAAPLLRVGAAEGPDRPEEDRRYHLLGRDRPGRCRDRPQGPRRDLGRDVALKVLREDHAENPSVVPRASWRRPRSGASSSTPAIVPVYDLGLQPDGRPYFAMKLVKGRTLAALLAAAADPDRGPPHASSEIFDQACQTVAYAHARGVHPPRPEARERDGGRVRRGPGRGLGIREGARSRRRRRRGAAEPSSGRARAVDRHRTHGIEGSESIVGSVMGTPAYMPPEQALGHVEDLDERTRRVHPRRDPLEILSGKPPYTGDARDVLIQAMRAHLDPAFGRLDACDADDALKDLARDCLHPVPGDRPTDAGVVATRLSDWMAAVDERAERAEVEAVEAAARLEREQARGAWERRARTRTRLGAAAAALAIVLGAGAFWLVDARRHARAEAARPAIEQALLEAARLEGRGELTDALAAAERARDLARTGGVSATLLDDATTRVTTLETALAAKRNEAARIADTQAFTAQLAEVLMDRWKDFNERDTDAEYRRMFAARGLDPLGDDPTRVAARIRELYPEVLVDVAAGLDGWASIRWKQEREDWPWASILACADAVDPEPLRTRIRAALAARDRGALRTLAEEHAEEDLPGPTVYLFGTALGRMYEEQGVKLRHALLQRRLLEHPDDFWVHA